MIGDKLWRWIVSRLFGGPPSIKKRFCTITSPTFGVLFLSCFRYAHNPVLTPPFGPFNSKPSSLPAHPHPAIPCSPDSTPSAASPSFYSSLDHRLCRRPSASASRSAVRRRRRGARAPTPLFRPKSSVMTCVEVSMGLGDKGAYSALSLGPFFGRDVGFACGLPVVEAG